MGHHESSGGYLLLELRISTVGLEKMAVFFDKNVPALQVNACSVITMVLE